MFALSGRELELCPHHNRLPADCDKLHRHSKRRATRLCKRPVNWRPEAGRVCSTTTRKLAIFIYRAEWVLSIVCGLTLLLSVWISFVLPRQVVKPLQELKEAVDHAA